MFSLILIAYAKNN